MKLPVADATTTSKFLFVYGTLMAPEVVKILLDRVPNHQKCRLIMTANNNYRRHPVRSHVFPGLIRTDDDAGDFANHGHEITGILYRGLTSMEMKRLDYFESSEYEKKPCSVVTEPDNEVVQALTYIWTNPRSELVEHEWSYEYFRENHLQDYLNHVVIPCKMEMDRTMEFR
jgi:gamma-glutamylcyclotransferase (GGCT)/AIG2-like uncharacterized protein YtfP